MKIITAANGRFEHYVRVLEQQCLKLDYELQIYDLGGLGRGIPLPVASPTFHRHGYYHQMHGNWKTKALHKPTVVADALVRFNEPIAYLDADAFPIARFDEIWLKSFNVGVTLRRPNDTSAAILGPINAGVLFFRPEAKAAVEFWQKLTKELGNDQQAMCKLFASNPEFKFHGFPGQIYNYYHFPETPGPETKIYHFKDAPNIRSCFDQIVESL